MEDLEDNHPACILLEEVLKAGERAAQLVSQLLQFSRRQIMRPEPLDLNKVVEDLLKMIRRVIGEHIRLDFNSAPELKTIHADRGMIEQALMNLCVNARDAMPRGGVLTISTSQVSLDARFCRSHEWAKPGEYILLEVVDTGTGMDQETLQHIYEPFFTTKETGKGTGLGLATVYGIVRQHEGMINVKSRLDQGTTFSVYLPVSGEPATQVQPETETTTGGGTETILLAEDDEMVRTLATNILQRAGYTVHTANNGIEAVQQFKTHNSKIDLVILDVVMPGMGGRQAYEQMLTLRPDLQALFASGYSESAIDTNFVLNEGLTLLQKPFAPSDLLLAVRGILDH
jgi:CheY-like chemotaxis protein